MSLTEDEVLEAEKQATATRDNGYALSARYDRRASRIVVDLSTGVQVAFPPNLAEGLSNASPDDLADIEISPSGLGLHWPNLDADLYVPAVLRGVLGSRNWTAARSHGDLQRQGKMRVRLPKPVAEIYRAVEELNRLYGTHKRKFTPDGHLVGSIGEVIAAEALGLTLYPVGRAGHDAHDGKGGDVQIKMTAGKSVAMYASAIRLVVLRVITPEEAEIVYDGPGEPAWNNARKQAKNGQRVVSLAKLKELADEHAKSAG